MNERDRARFRAKVASPDDNGCMLWLAALNADGYGIFSSTVGALAHRYAYVQEYGPIAEGLEIDHLCRVRHCVNPEHLEAVTHAENVRRAPAGVSANAAKTHCPQGHEYAGDNLYVTPLGDRRCRACAESHRVRNRNQAPVPQSGYTHCACRDCMDITVSSDVNSPELCSECADAGCEAYRPGDSEYDSLPGHMRECRRNDAYGEC